MTIEPHDQTRGDSMPFFQDKQPAPLSCNEVASLCMKAARGAGMSWGMAEEAGYAASWLVTHGIDGPAQMRDHLEQAESRNWPDLSPTVTRGDWRNTDGNTVCPIILGATLCDYAALPEGPVAGATIKFGPVSHPILLIPFLADIAQGNGVTITLSWAEGTVRIGEGDAWPTVAANALHGAQYDLTLTAQAAATFLNCERSLQNADTGADTIDTLNAFAMRTTVPSSEQSRAGAGSTLGDND